jgi:hypothetical protein
MALVGMTGFEAQAISIDAITLTGTAAYSTAQHRTGAASVRMNPASGAQGAVQYAFAGEQFVHFGLYVATLPSIDRLVFGTISATRINLRLTSAGTLTCYANTTLLGTSAAYFATPGWHWVGVRTGTGTSVDFLQVDGHTEVNATATLTATSGVVGFWGTEATAVDAYIDDLMIDDTGLLQPSNVNIALPISDNARGSGWVGGAGGTTNLWDAVNNIPPVGVADTGTDTSQIRNATAAASTNYDANLQSYTTLGLGPEDVVLAVQPLISTAAPVVTSAKQGTVGMASNPAITLVALGAGGTSGAFWSGLAGGTFVTGWKASFGTLTTTPVVTLSTSPVMRVQQVTSSTRIADVCFMGLLVAWTPAPLPYTSPYPPLIAQ